MRVEALKVERISDFVAYCKKHKNEVDDSYLYESDLHTFEPNDENPTYIVMNDLGEIIAAASLVIDEYHKRGKKARFRIFHSEKEDSHCYHLLWQSVLKHTRGLDKVFIFVPMKNKKLASYMEELKFSIERYSFVLVREDLEVPEVNLPEDYEIRTFQPGQDEENWVSVRNPSFATLLGSETPQTPEMVTKMVLDGDYIEGGMKILFHHERPVGVIRGADDEYEGKQIMNIGPIAIIPEYQGKGLGRSLLRTSLLFAKEKGYKQTILCVNGENERAKALYLQEGFEESEAVICYQYIF